MTPLLADAAVATRTLGRLAAIREDWAEGLDASTGAFLRSFVAPLLSIFFALSADAAMSAATRPDSATAGASLWVGALGPVLDAALFAGLTGLLVTAFGGKAGYVALVVTINWLNFWLNLLLSAVGLAVGFGLPEVGLQLAGFFLFSLSLFLTWRAARESLTGELGLSLAVTLLAFGSKVFGYVVAAAVVGVFS